MQLWHDSIRFIVHPANATDKNMKCSLPSHENVTLYLIWSQVNGCLQLLDTKICISLPSPQTYWRPSLWQGYFCPLQTLLLASTGSTCECRGAWEQSWILSVLFKPSPWGHAIEKALLSLIGLCISKGFLPVYWHLDCNCWVLSDIETSCVVTMPHLSSTFPPPLSSSGNKSGGASPPHRQWTVG